MKRATRNIIIAAAGGVASVGAIVIFYKKISLLRKLNEEYERFIQNSDQLIGMQNEAITINDKYIEKLETTIEEDKKIIEIQAKQIASLQANQRPRATKELEEN